MQSSSKSSLAALTLGAIGVVYGDIGTSVLYAVKEVFGSGHVPFTHENIYGILSIFFWTLTVIVSLKYVVLVLRADNNGEGGLIAMLALASQAVKDKPKLRGMLLAVGIFGTSLFYGDGVITPAISVLSAVEGLEVVSPHFKKYVIPLTLVVLFCLFAVQKRGTGGIGKFFGPITLVWFMTLAVLGVFHIHGHPEILWAMSPHHALMFMWHQPGTSFIILGAVVLCVTGAEALYADLGHFGKRPIRLAWFGVAMPSLTLNYFGQGALLLAEPEAVKNPFFMMAPDWALIPLVGLATLATVIASQALITGAFSVTKQVIQLGYLPRLNIQHTSDSEIGQIYIPLLNWLLFISIIILVLLFESSSRLAGAYGLAVTVTMFCDTLLVGFLAYSYWKWKTWKVLLFIVPFIFIDLILLSSNTLKILIGGWVPVVIAITVFSLMMIWKKGKEKLQAKLQQDTLPLVTFIEYLGDTAQTVSGNAVFLTGTPNVVPHALLHNLKHNKVLHERNLLVTVNFAEVPYISEEMRFETEALDKGFYRIRLNYGFKEQPNLPRALRKAFDSLGLEYNLMDISFFVSRERLIPNMTHKMDTWRDKLFAAMQKNTSPVSDFYQIPTNRVVELGSQIEI